MGGISILIYKIIFYKKLFVVNICIIKKMVEKKEKILFGFCFF